MHNRIYIMYEVNEWESVFFLIPRTPSRNWLCKKQAATPPNRPSIHPSITKKTRSTMVIIIVIRKHQGDNKAYRQTADGQCWMDRQNRQIFSYCYDHRFRRIKIWTKMFFSRLRFTSARRQCVAGWLVVVMMVYLDGIWSIFKLLIHHQTIQIQRQQQQPPPHHIIGINGSANCFTAATMIVIISTGGGGSSQKSLASLRVVCCRIC